MDSSQFMVRERTPLALMLYGVYVYLSSNSLRRASSILEPLIERSHEAIRQWVQRLAPVCDRFDVDRRLVHIIIFVDETMIRIRGREALGLGRVRAGVEDVPRVPRVIQSEHPRCAHFPEASPAEIRDEADLD
jgi:hypothetical protein